MKIVETKNFEYQCLHCGCLCGQPTQCLCGKNLTVKVKTNFEPVLDFYARHMDAINDAFLSDLVMAGIDMYARYFKLDAPHPA